MRELTTGERFAWQFAWLTAACIPLTLVALALDDRLVNGISVWIKPLKFELSIIVHLVTLAVLVRFIPATKRFSTWLTIVLAVIAVASFSEIAIISFQSMRGVGSHFNISTSFDAGLYQAMGVFAVLLTLPVAAVGMRFATLPAGDILTPSLKLGAALGLTLGSVLTLFIAGYLSMQMSGHWVAAPPTDVGGFPITGWSRAGGDLRVPHFFATHLMQIVPLVGWLADRRLGSDSPWPRRLVWLTAIAGVVLIIATFLQARSGQAFV